MRKHTLNKTAGIAFLCASFISAAAMAVDETEPNQPIGSAQSLAVVGGTAGAKGSATVNGVVGSLTSYLPVNDVDFYSFYAQADDVISVNIDCGMNCGTRFVKSLVGIFGPAPDYKLQLQNWYASSPDAGSKSQFDARIDKYKVPVSGIYTVGVTASSCGYMCGRRFSDGGAVTNSTKLDTMYGNGDYTLIISGLSSPVLTINIDIKPGDGTSDAPINPKSKGKIPVALLSSTDFSAVTVKVNTLRFKADHPNASEVSPSQCGNDGEDVNGDGVLDLVCHFDNQSAGFLTTDETGIVTGETGDGRRFEGRANLKVTPVPHAE